MRNLLWVTYEHGGTKFRVPSAPPASGRPRLIGTPGLTGFDAAGLAHPFVRAGETEQRIGIGGPGAAR